MTGLSRLSATPNDGAVVACLQLSEAVDIADRPVIHNHPWLSAFADNRRDRVKNSDNFTLFPDGRDNTVGVRVVAYICECLDALWAQVFQMQVAYIVRSCASGVFYFLDYVADLCGCERG